MSDLPPPFVLGLPEKYDRWRSMQAEAVEAVGASDKRFVLIAAPTGFGKSLTYVATAKMADNRTCILTSTKGLQSQLTRDFGSTGLVDIRGMNSYDCLAGRDFGMKSASCADGPCHVGYQCPLKHDGCLYFDALRAAIEAPMVVTNYHYWMHINEHTAQGIGPFGMLVLDEAHDAPDAVVDFVGITLDPRELGLLLQDGRTPEIAERAAAWRAWAQDKFQDGTLLFNELVAENEQRGQRGLPPELPKVHRAIRLRSLLKKLERTANIGDGWVIEQQEKLVRLDPIWPGQHAEHSLFRGVPKVVMYSATLRPKIASLLGIRKGAFDFIEYPSSFPKERRPIIHVPTVAVRYDTTDSELEVWVRRMDQIIGQRLDRKGIIHSVSFARRDLIVSNSEHKHVMLWNSSESTASVIEKFRRMKPPAVLVTPSVMTGWDFPATECEYQIISKVPFPVFTTAIARARDKQDAEWSKYITVMQLVQASGRDMRAEDDQCETFIVDDNIVWLVRKYRHIFPAWWLEAGRFVRTIPPPLIKL